jgi:hypothetical protein
MKVMKLKVKHVDPLDWNHTYYLNEPFARRFIKNGCTHVEFKGRLIEIDSSNIGPFNVTFEDPIYTEKKIEDDINRAKWAADVLKPIK